MQGKIIRGVAGFYYVNVEGEGVFECKAKGIFRYRKVKPLPGDNVGLTVISREAMTGNIDEIYGRDSELVRPAVANACRKAALLAARCPAHILRREKAPCIRSPRRSAQAPHARKQF